MKGLMGIRQNGHVRLDLSLSGRKITLEMAFIKLCEIGSENKLHHARSPAKDTYDHRRERPVESNLAIISLVEYSMS